MEDHELHDIIQRTSKETATAIQAEIRDQVDAGVRDAFVRVGIDTGDPIEMQQDMVYLRDWRKTSRAVKRRGLITAVGILVTGVLGAVWLGLRSMLG